MTVTISFSNVSPEVMHKSTNETMTAKELLMTVFLEEDIFDIENVLSSELLKDTVEIEDEATCDAGFGLTDDVCVECTKGSFLNETSKMCQKCPLGSFTDQDRQTSCTPCGEGETTLQVGAHFCNKSCTPGSYLVDGECEPCPKNFYQNESGQVECLSCPAGKATEQNGSDSDTLCFDTCKAGEELRDGECQKCLQGFYRDGVTEEQETCQMCPTGNTTAGEGSTSYTQCDHVACDPGYKRDPNANECVVCGYGFYQPEMWQDSCLRCNDSYSTRTNTSTDPGDCEFHCPSGQNVTSAEDEECTPCDRGYYKTNDGHDVFDNCEPCPFSNMTTDGTASESVNDCDIPVCEAGQEVRGDLSGCDDCGVDYYQSLARPSSTDLCEACSDNEGTMDPKQTSEDACMPYCEPGEQYDADQSMCVACPMGTWNTGNHTQRFEQCAECPSGYVTVDEMEGATSSDNCTLRNCSAGEKIVGDDCVPCDFGYYQDTPRQDSCERCPENTNTTGVGSDEEDDCTISCGRGKTQSELGEECVLCEFDYIKDYAGSGTCDQCGGNYTSNPERTACDVLFCDRGFELDGDSCTPCDVGKYKENRGNDTMCVSCPANSTTEGLASSSEEECDKAYCVEGFYSPDDTLPCLPCPVGYYKDGVGNQNCTSCGDNFTTEGLASEVQGDCSLVVCNAGRFRNDSNMCNPCSIGEYQDERGRSECKDCDDGYTTLDDESDDFEDCRIVCHAGQYRNDSSNTCRNCSIGYYQENSGRIACDKCDDDFTTEMEGSTSETDCYKTCSVGSKSISRTECEVCPRGEYQGSEGAASCNSCGENQTTHDTGSDSVEDCMPICEAGEYLNTTDRTCNDCDYGTYNPNAGTMTEFYTSCEDCEDGKTTGSRRATSQDQCSLPDCDPGQYRADDGCQLCDYGYYQSQRSQTFCIQCSNNWITLLQGRISIDYCVVYCPDGRQYNFEIDDCEDCHIGYYREASTNDQLCTKCPLGQTTTSTQQSSCIAESVPQPWETQTISVELVLIFTVQYCSNPEQIRNTILVIISDIMEQTAGNYMGLCIGDCENLAVILDEVCSEGSSRRKRSASEQVVTIRLTDVNNEIENINNNKTYETEAVVKNAFYDHQPNQDIMDANGITFERIQNFTSTLQCQPGQERDGSGCSNCETGKYSTDGSVCMECAEHTYQNRTGQSNCMPCPDKTYTTSTGTMEITGCTKKCDQPNARDTHCSGRGQCQFDAYASDGVRCVCDDDYEGVSCQARQDSSDDKTPMIVGIACGAAGFLLLVLLIVGLVACLRRAGKNGKKNGNGSNNGVTGYTNSVTYMDDGMSDRYLDYHYPPTAMQHYDNMPSFVGSRAIMPGNPSSVDQDVRDFYVSDKYSDPPSRSRSRTYESEWRDL